MSDIPYGRMAEAALHYASEWGWRVFPCRPGEKQPMTAHGFKDAVTHPDVLRQWFRPALDGREPNIGLDIPEDMLILDFDPRNGAPNPEDFQNPYWPATSLVRTPGGGHHLYYRLDPEVADVETVGKWPDVPGIDIKRGGKGYVLLPPSSLASLNGGTELRIYGRYEWVSEPRYTATLGIDALAPIIRKTRALPSGDVVVTRAAYFPWETGSRFGLGVLSKRLDLIRNAKEGTRNNTLFSATAQVSQFIAGGELDEKCLEQVRDAALSIGLDIGEVMETMRSAYEVGITDPRRRT